MKNILIGGAWPYANGSLHIGHIAALLPGDVLARYHRAIGNNVFYVSGSDCHGTPITIRAKQEGKTPGEISDFYHAEFVDVFNRLGFSYDLYTKTSDVRHIEFVREFHKKIYIWAENVLGYLSASAVVCRERGISFSELFGENARHYYVHGKDNIPFHTIILPSLLLAHGGKFRLPDDIISSEYLTLEGRKISTSQNWAIWAKDIVGRYNSDALRYFFIANGPEKRDTDFSWREFVERNNNELLGAYGNFVNRTLAFITKYQGGIVPEGKVDSEVSSHITAAFHSVGQKIEDGQLKDALDDAFELVRFGNKYFDSGEPWKTRTENATTCGETIFNCVQLIASLAALLEPFLPFSSAKIRGWLCVDRAWGIKSIPAGFQIPEPEILFERIDRKVVDEEVAKLLGKQSVAD